MKKKQEQQPTKNSRRSHEYVKLEEGANSRSFSERTDHSELEALW
jgi:hypothetical protein